MASDQKERKSYSINVMIRFLILGLFSTILGLIFILVWLYTLFDEHGQFVYSAKLWWILPGVGVIVGGIALVILIMWRLLHPSPEEQVLLPANYSIHSKEGIKKLIRPLKIGMYIILGIIITFVIGVIVVLRF